MMKTTTPVKRVVLAYSGGLDTSIIVHWLKRRYECEVICYCSDVGQGAELQGLAERARRLGADRVVVEDLRMTFVRDYCFPALRAGAVYEGRYLLGTSLARPLIAARQVACALEHGADAVAHGCTGKGNDQVRFELTYMALAPELTVLAPWRDPKWTIRSREDALRYAAEHGLEVHQTAKDLYSRDGNLWHLSHEGGVLEDPAQVPEEDMFRLTAAAVAQPVEPEFVRVGFEAGRPIALDGQELDPVTLLERLNALAARHGVGRADLVESRLVGMKSRGVYETPAGTVLHEAIEDLCRLVLPHDLHRTRATLALQMADLIYSGQWFSPLRRSLQAFADNALQVATGTVTVALHHGQAQAAARTSPMSLYQTELASFDMTGYDAGDAEGFIRLFGLPLAAASQRGGRKSPIPLSPTGSVYAPQVPASGPPEATSSGAPHAKGSAASQKAGAAVASHAG